MKNAHFDDDLGYFHIHMDDCASLELHRDSIVDGHTMVPLGAAAVHLARDILVYSGQADAATVQRVADTMEALADEGHGLTAEEMREIAAVLRHGGMVKPRVASNVVQFRPAVRCAAVRLAGVVG